MLTKGLAFGALAMLSVAAPAFAYPNATIANGTQFPVTGTVVYAACRSDHFSIPAAHHAPTGRITNTQTTIAARRGACLIRRVEAAVNGKAATPFTSIGSAKSRFIVVHNRYGQFVVREEPTL